MARGRDVDMGGTIVDAVDKRRAGPDLSPVPDALRPLVERMLVANPADRIRSMDDVVQWLSDWSRGSLPTSGAWPGVKMPKEPGPDRMAAFKDKLGGITARLRVPAALKEPRGMMIAGGGALGLLVLVAVVLSFTGGNSHDAAAGDAAGGEDAKASVEDPVAAAKSVLGSGLSQVPCSWLDAESVDGGNGAPVTVALKGVSGQTATAMSQVEAMLKKAGVGGVSVSYADIAPVPGTFCGPLGAFGQFRVKGVSHLSAPQVKYEMAPLQGNLPQQFIGQPGATAIINIDLASTSGDVAVIGIAESGEMGIISKGLKDLPPQFLEDQGNQKYRLSLPTTNRGWSGILMVQGKGPFDAALLQRPAGEFGADWPQKFIAAAQAQGWKTDMVWYQLVNDQPDAAPPK